MDRRPILNIYGYIYITVNLINSKKYIGKHTWSNPYLDENYLGSGVAFKKALEKYGVSSFRTEILDWAESERELNELEKMYIAEYNAADSSEFYNISPGGDNGGWNVGRTGELSNNWGRHWSEETRRKMSKSNRCLSGERNGMHGRHHSEETKRLYSIQRTGERNGMYGNKQYIGEGNPFYGKTHSDESKERMRQAHLGKPATHLFKPVVQLTPDNILVATYPSIAATQEKGFKRDSVSECCRKLEKVYKGYKFMYLEDYEKFK